MRIDIEWRIGKLENLISLLGMVGPVVVGAFKKHFEDKVEVSSEFGKRSSYTGIKLEKFL